MDPEIPKRKQRERTKMSRKDQIKIMAGLKMLIMLGIFMMATTCMLRYFLLQRKFKGNTNTYKFTIIDSSNETEDDSFELMLRNFMYNMHSRIVQLLELGRRSEVIKIKTIIQSANCRQKVNNKFLNSVKPEDSIVIVVRVGTSPNHLYHLITSLAEVAEKDKLFVIFAHSFYDFLSVETIKHVKFVKYIQIFYPYPCSLYYDTFPGKGSLFCAEEGQCTLNNNRRNATKVEEKHLWWWTMGKVFNLTELANYTRHVVFVDDHSYIAKDIVNSIEVLNKSIGNVCPHCEFLHFGGLVRSNESLAPNNSVMITPFGYNHITNGIAFNRSTWNKITNSKAHFCLYNDFGWVESLINVIKNSAGQFSVMNTLYPKVFNTEFCAVQLKEILCPINGTVIDDGKIQQMLKVGNFNNDSVTVVSNNDTLEMAPVLQRGGWEDVRDRHLCMQNKVKDL